MSHLDDQNAPQKQRSQLSSSKELEYPPMNSAVLHRDLHKEPEHVEEASGLYLVLFNKKRIIDATGGAAVSCIGHGDERVRDAIAAQLTKLDYCHSLFFSCPSSEALSRLLVDSTDGKMARAFIVNSGMRLLIRRVSS